MRRNKEIHEAKEEEKKQEEIKATVDSLKSLKMKTEEDFIEEIATIRYENAKLLHRLETAEEKALVSQEKIKTKGDELKLCKHEFKEQPSVLKNKSQSNAKK